MQQAILCCYLIKCTCWKSKQHPLYMMLAFQNGSLRTQTKDSHFHIILCKKLVEMQKKRCINLLYKTNSIETKTITLASIGIKGFTEQLQKKKKVVMIVSSNGGNNQQDGDEKKTKIVKSQQRQQIRRRLKKEDSSEKLNR